MPIVVRKKTRQRRMEIEGWWLERVDKRKFKRRWESLLWARESAKSRR